MAGYSGFVGRNMERMTRTSENLPTAVDDATPHVVRPTPRDHTGRRLLWFKVGFRARSIRSKHLFELTNFEGVSTDHSKTGDRYKPAPLTPERLTTWMYQTPEIIEWLTLKVSLTLISHERSARIILSICTRTCTQRLL